MQQSRCQDISYENSSREMFWECHRKCCVFSVKLKFKEVEFIVQKMVNLVLLDDE